MQQLVGALLDLLRNAIAVERATLEGVRRISISRVPGRRSPLSSSGISITKFIYA
jgi:hypothetical protein